MAFPVLRAGSCSHPKTPGSPPTSSKAIAISRSAPNASLFTTRKLSQPNDLEGLGALPWHSDSSLCSWVPLPANELEGAPSFAPLFHATLFHPDAFVGMNGGLLRSHKSIPLLSRVFFPWHSQLFSISRSPRDDSHCPLGFLRPPSLFVDLPKIQS